ncbi:TetR/AcrR family transcriptional regulator C-terminal domain-containing protein [Lacticaseibacillus pabuli]|uniref:TetR/AcrR family transcriptional regulator C-terminal domain-containing protein n=1 Tax=Lacticaseibacillus pabuli TaxID=3025672 RepID=A0ABY7WUE3_9LACO|nr:TetR/AcrR family transcriptional regulator [Lacticaseibacillus sp. KACC 23028]WDF82775.1 TetR/AcrR family transcriptional regulator C-terminal domain-containing protein [Lacticaseibacillus sp. KACC 23028]
MANATKQLLADTLRDMMQTQSLNRITIDALTTAAHVNRNTFYYHFDDINALLEWTLNQEIISRVQANLTAKNWQDKYQMTLDYIKTNANFCLAVMHSLGRQLLEQFLLSVGESVVSQVVRDIDPHLNVDTAAEIVNFYAGALSAQLVLWLDGDLKEPEETLLTRADLMLSGTIELIIAKKQKA